MTRRTLLLLILAVILFYACLVLIWITAEPPRTFRHPDMTPAERHMIEGARKKHGAYPITREGERGIYIMHRNGERIYL